MEMGVYNIVNFKDTCLCGLDLGEMQTKDDTNKELWLHVVEPQSVREWGAYCHTCHKWYDYLVSKDKSKVARRVSYQVIELTEMPLADSGKE
jgi:hypothetical protein